MVFLWARGERLAVAFTFSRYTSTIILCFATSVWQQGNPATETALRIGSGGRPHGPNLMQPSSYG